MNSHLYKALILDDEFFLGEVLVKALQDEGIESIAVTNVDAAISKLQKETYDIVISDIYLPDKSGQDLFDYAQKHHPDLPFIFITGNPNIETAVNFLKKGAYDYLPKPFLLPELIQKVRDVISKSRKRREEKNLVNNMKQILNKRFKELRIYQDIFESKKDGLLIVDSEGLIVRVNPGFEQMSGLKESDLINQHLAVLNERIFPKLDFPEIKEAIFRKGQWKEEIKAARINGDSWIANLSFFGIQDESNNTFAYSAIINDVTSLRHVENALIESLKSTNLAQEAIIFGLARLAEFRDRETGYHLERIRNYCRELAIALSNHPLYEEHITEKFIDTLYRTAPLHDIGKVGIPDHILLKEGALTEEEYNVMKTHTVIGYETLNSIRKQYGDMDFLNMGIDITYAHHERYDGNGYPQGLKGDEIPLAAHIVSFADIYDALTSERVYKKAFSHDISLNTMRMERGKHFNPEMFDVFLTVSDKFNKIRKEFREQARFNQEVKLLWS